MRTLSFCVLLISCSLASANSDDDALPPGTKFRVESISGRTDDIRSNAESVKISSPTVGSTDSALTISQTGLVGGKAGISASETAKTIVVDLPADILFDFDHSDLKVGAEESLRRLAQLISTRAKHNVVINGYTDSKGSAAYNQKLSVERAESVRRWLIGEIKSPAIAFAVVGHGAENPVAPNTTPDGRDNPAGRAINRRVEITIEK